MFVDPILKSRKVIERAKDERTKRIQQFCCTWKEVGTIIANSGVVGLHTATGRTNQSLVVGPGLRSWNTGRQLTRRVADKTAFDQRVVSGN